MNSTLQCLAHTSPLRSYFLSGEFANDLNRDNPLGTGGELAQEFAKLLAEMWGTKQEDDSGMKNLYSSSSRNGGYRRSWSNTSGTCNVVYPRDFKYTLGKHAEQFIGYNQHDSQELATYLLDALHEDTNRVSKKPYIEKPEQGEDESDHDAATRAWDLHLKREDSRVMENFMGQVKSRVECPVDGCGRVSTTFDPFMYLSVPLPGAQDRTIEIQYIPIHLEKETVKRVKVTISKTATCGELKKKFLAALNEQHFSLADPVMNENVILAEIFQSDIYTFYESSDEIDKIRDGDFVVAYEVTSTAAILEEAKKFENQNPAINANDSLDNLLDDRPFGKVQLDLETKTKLNTKDSWEIALGTYINNSPTYLPSLLNPKRMKSEKEKFYKTLCSFVNRCYASLEVSNALRGASKIGSDDVELDSCDGNDSEDGKMSPTSTVVSRLGATAVDDEPDVQSLEEICEASSTFKKVTSVEDVAKLEFCCKKFRQYLKNLKVTNRSDFINGAEIQVTFNRKSRLVNKATAKPIVLRIAPNTTVFRLREIIAERMSHVLHLNVDKLQEDERVQPEEGSNGAMDIDGDQNSNPRFQSSDALNIIRRIPLTYERARGMYASTYSTATYGSNSYRRLGSISMPDEIVSTSTKTLYAKPDDEDEKELVLEHLGKRGKVQINFDTSLGNVFDDSKWMTVETSASPKNEDKGETISVLDCISKYCQVEQLEETEMWYCNRCKDHVRAWKQFHLYRTPPILIIHLKRFHYSARSHRRDKIDAHIDFPLEGLDLSDEVMFSRGGEEPIYDCYAVSNHFGGLGGGHYTAYALNDDGEWCNFDDSRVTKNIDKNEVVSKAAYVLYYKRRDVKNDDESWVNRALPSLCSRESSPVTTDMDIETDNDVYSMDDNNNDDEYGIKNFESIMP